MDKKTILITGASGGIGQAVVKHFSSLGWRVLGVDKNPYPGTFPGDGEMIQADVSLPRDWKKIGDEVGRITNDLDALINNAALQITKPILETSLEEWDAVFDANLRAVFLAAKTFHPYLKNNEGGAIVNVSSVHAIATSKDIATYAASKGGMVSLTRSMAIEFASDDIRVNAILPGAVDTTMLREGMNRGHAGQGSIQRRLENLASNTVSGKIGQPEEIARAIYFLADKTQSSFMTGQTLVIDGGATAKLSTE